MRLLPDGGLAIGRLTVGPAILGYGSAGTVVYDGVLDGRWVGVKDRDTVCVDQGAVHREYCTGTMVP